ncbi:MAG TPA: MarR family transcriptional regulator [Candidatus Sulfotelmatobacter sp.]|nr:MarR family transcriptional regulator [Candidatus Sulfotelmatobacter sp.]
MSQDKLDGIVAQWKEVRPDLDTASMALFGRLARLRGHLEREINKVLTGQGLPVGGFDVLATLRRLNRPDGLSANELLAQMMITSGTLTHRLDLLEKAGWLVRRANPADGRGVLVALTEAGREMVDTAVEAHLANQQRLLEGVRLDQRDALSQLLKIWLAKFE